MRTRREAFTVPRYHRASCMFMQALALRYVGRTRTGLLSLARFLPFSLTGDFLRGASAQAFSHDLNSLLRRFSGYSSRSLLPGSVGRGEGGFQSAVSPAVPKPRGADVCWCVTTQPPESRASTQVTRSCTARSGWPSVFTA